MSILIAGCGYVGSALAAALAARGERVIGVRRDPTKIPQGVVAIGADLLDRRAIAAIPRDVTRLVYAAAPERSSPEAYRAAYVEGLRSVIDALRGAPVRRAIVTTSTAVYGSIEGWVDEDSPVAPQGNASYLLEAEAIVRDAFEQGIALRLAGIYGPGRDRIVRSVADGTARMPRAPRYGNRIHRDDAARAIEVLLAVERPRSIYVGVDDDPADLREVYAWVARELAVAPPPLEEDAGSSERGTRKRCRNARLRAAGWVPTYPSFREGYRDAIATASARR